MPPGEAESKDRKPFFERNWFRATVAVVGLVASLWAFVGLPTPSHVVKDIASHTLPLRNVEIVLDASSRMGAKFGGATKLEVAAEAVDQYVAPDEHVGLALRRAGGSCGEGAEPIVSFDDGQTEKIAAVAKQQKPAGKSNWALAVRGAINDFSAEGFHRPDSENEVVLFVGGDDQCGGLVGEEIRNELQHANLHAQFRVFALKVPKRELKSLAGFKRQLSGVAAVELHKANSVQQLYQAVQEESGGGVPESPGGGEGGSGSGGGGPVEAGGPAAESLSATSSEDFVFEEAGEEIPEPTEAERLEKEKEERAETEEEEKEERLETEAAEEEIEVESAAEAPDTVVEPDGEGGEGEGALGESKPAPTPEPVPEAGKGRPRLSSAGLIRSMTPSWTSCPSGRAGRGNLPTPPWASCRVSWVSMPSSCWESSEAPPCKTRSGAGSTTRSSSALR